jgi:hypothetical protein
MGMVMVRALACVIELVIVIKIKYGIILRTEFVKNRSEEVTEVHD